jgi:hypothetical protein
MVVAARPPAWLRGLIARSRTSSGNQVKAEHCLSGTGQKFATRTRAGPTNRKRLTTGRDTIVTTLVPVAFVILSGYLAVSIRF